MFIILQVQVFLGVRSCWTSEDGGVTGYLHCQHQNLPHTLVEGARTDET